MATEAELIARLATATPAAGVPRTGGLVSGRAPLPAIPTTDNVRSRRNAIFERILVDPSRVLQSRLLLNIELAERDVCIDLFTATPSKEVAGVQIAFLNTICQTISGWVWAEEDFGSRIPDLLRVAASATPAGVALRELYAPPWVPRTRTVGRTPAPSDPPDWTEFPGIPTKLLKDAQELISGHCAGVVADGLKRWGDAMAGSAATYPIAPVSLLDPVDACAGKELTITGIGFGAQTTRAVAFTGEHSKAILVEGPNILSWSDTEIRLMVPVEARRGPVAIVELPDTATPRAASHAFMVGLATCFGPAVLARMQTVLNGLYPGLGSPPLQGDGANLFKGGPPTIEYFVASPSTSLVPGRKIELRYGLQDADDVRIVVRDVDGKPNELPAIAQTLNTSSDSISVTVPGTRPWKGEYVLQATNHCTTNQPVESPISFEMRFRRGLALGGGGSRGDFQTGALQYIYGPGKFRPDAIASTSVGSINAAVLVQGDDSAPGTNAAEKLAKFWLDLREETDMWADEPWLRRAKTSVRQLLRSLSLEGLMVLPYTAIADANALSDVMSALNNAQALFNISPIEHKMNQNVDLYRAGNSGISLRMVSVSIETGALIMVDEGGTVLERGRPTIRPNKVPPAPVTNLVDGAIASATMPGVFPARRLRDHMCVDGGVREVVPVQTAVDELGCNEVIAIRVSAPPAVKHTDPSRGVGSVIARSVLELTFDEIAESDLNPFNGWGEGVKVTTISPTINLHDPMVIEPGLIRIAMDYGWMRAGEILDFKGDQQYARTLSDEITSLRAQNWKHTHWLSRQAQWRDPHRGFTEFLLAGFTPRNIDVLVTVPKMETVGVIRNNCKIIRELVARRKAEGMPLPASDVTRRWFEDWEAIRKPPIETSPWSTFYLHDGTVESEAPPPPVV